MKKVLLLVCFALLISSLLSNTHSSDNVSFEKVEKIFERYIKSSPSVISQNDQVKDEQAQKDQENQPQKHADSAQKDPNKESVQKQLRKKKLNDELSFVYECCAIHDERTKYPKTEARLDFFQSPRSFQAYAKGHWTANSELKKTWFFYHTEAALFFLELDNMSEAEKNLLKAGEILPGELRVVLGSFAAEKFSVFKVNSSKKKELPFKDLRNEMLLLQKFALLYENVRIAQTELPFDSIDYITLSILYSFAQKYEKGIEFGLKALEAAWPSPEDRYFRIKTDLTFIKRCLAHNYFKLKDFQKTLQILSEVSEDNYEVEDYMTMATIYSLQQKWDQSFKYFKIFNDLAIVRSLFQGGKYYNIEEEDVVILLQMLMHIPQRDFREHGRRFVNLLKEQIPPLESDVNALLEFLKQKQETASRMIVRKAIVQQIFNRMNDAFQFFNHRYQNLWAHVSLVSPEVTAKLLDPLNKIIEKVETEYYQFITLMKNECTPENISLMINLSRSLEETFATFFDQSNEVDHEISKARRFQHQRQLTTTRGSEEFIVFDPASFRDSKSLKALFTSEQKQRQSESERKEKAIEERKQQRKDRREPLVQAFQEKTKPEGTEAEKEKSSPLTTESMICSFKDTRLENLWKTKELGGYPQNILEMLGALHQAKSIFQLRTLLRPGAALEMLKGDRNGQISLRVNDQYRLCFYWISGEGAYAIEMIDYH